MLEFLRFYSRPQSYSAEIRVTVENRGTKIATTTVIVPVPRTTGYQTTTPEFHESTRDFPLELQPGEIKVVSVSFKAHVVPRRYEGVIPPEIVRSNNFVLEYLTYGNAIDGLYTAQEAREKRVVDCGGFDTLLQDELRKVGIESEVVAGFWSDGNLPAGKAGMHAWLDIGGIPADPSMEWLRARGKTKKSGRLGFVGSDRIAFSIGEPFLQKPICDLPHENHLYITRA